VVAVTSAKDVKCDTVIVDPKTQIAYSYDLSSLHHDDKTYIDSLWYRTPENHIYYVNFCGQTASACESNDTSVCMRIPDGGDFKYISGGSTSTQEFSLGEDPLKSIVVTYSNGDKCDNSSRTYQTKIIVNCQPTAEPGFFYDVDETDKCQPILFMYSAAGCGKSVGSSSSSSSSGSVTPTDFCAATVSEGGKSYHFDLTPLYHSDQTPVDALWYRTVENNVYYVNFCGQSSSCAYGDTSVCIRLKDSGFTYVFVSGGSTSTQKFSRTKGEPIDKSITVTYSDGSKCGSDKMKTNLVIYCHPDADPGFFYDIDIISECEATLYMYSAAGCGKEVA